MTAAHERSFLSALSASIDTVTDEEEVWRPLGVDTDEEIAEYDALHEGLPLWMKDQFWDWLWFALQTRNGVGAREVNWPLVTVMGQALRVPLPNMKDWQRHNVETVLYRLDDEKILQVADYLLAHGVDTFGDLPEALNGILSRCNSAWTVGERAGRRGLVRRVPEGVQVAADAVMGRAGRAGVRLAKAWEALYGLAPNPSQAYSLAIKSIEDATVPIVSPNNSRATLGTVIGQITADADWKLPMVREPAASPTKEVVLGMLRVVWEGQHDRHGGPIAPGDVSQDEAASAVLLAVVLVGWFDAGLVARRQP